MRKFDLFWCLLVSLGLVCLFRYQGSTGRPAQAPSNWPACLPAGPNFTLVLFAHPKCPCTRASLRQLQRLLRETPDAPVTYVVFTRPESRTEDFAHTELTDLAQRLDGVRTIADEGAIVGSAFGSYTSGQVLLYGPDGRLRFAGGLTVGRGHEGDSAGLDRLMSILGGGDDVAATAVYGCSLASTDDEFCAR